MNSHSFPIAIRCPRLTAPANGRVSAPLRTVNSEATYSCNEGYRLDGASTRICQSNSEWSGQEPVCVGAFTTPHRMHIMHIHYLIHFNLFQHDCFVSSTEVDCGPLPDIPQGRVEFSTTTFNSRANYVCNPGYSIVGTSVRTCLAVGVWSGREPTCTRKHTYHSTSISSKLCGTHLTLYKR